MRTWRLAVTTTAGLCAPGNGERADASRKSRLALVGASPEIATISPATDTNEKLSQTGEGIQNTAWTMRAMALNEQVSK